MHTVSRTQLLAAILFAGLACPAVALAQLGVLQEPTITSASWDGKGVITIAWDDMSTSDFYQIRWQPGPAVTSRATQSRDTGHAFSGAYSIGSFKVLESQPGPYSFIVQGCIRGAGLLGTSVGCSAWSAPVTVTIPAGTPQGVPFTFTNLSAGDCRMQSGTIVFRSNGSATFNATVETVHTHSGDIWHATISGLDASKKAIVVLPTIDSPTMSDNHGWYSWTHSFSYNGASFPQLHSARMHSSC